MKTITFTAAQIRRARLSALYDLYEETFARYYDSTFVEGRGNPHPRMVFIGEAPTAIDDREQKAFAGQSGKFIAQLLKDAGLDPKEAFFTYFTKYKPPPKDGNPILAEMGACSFLMKKELEALEPTIVIPMGTNAVSLFFEDRPHMDTMVGRVFEKRGYVILPMYHPAAAMFEDHTKQMTEVHFQILAKTLEPKRRQKRGTKSLYPAATKSLYKKSLRPSIESEGKSLRKVAS